MDLIPTPEQLSAATANVFDRIVRGGLADLRPIPSAIVDEGPQRTVRRYLRQGEERGAAPGADDRPPVLLVPPLAAPATCFDLRRGCSVAEHLRAADHRTYLVDYGAIAFGDRNLGIEHWIDEVIPRSIDAVLADSGAEQVQLVGWCLGGIMALLVAADQPARIRSVAMVASPIDSSAVPLVAPLRPLVNLAGGSVGTLAYKALGGAPAPLVRRAYQLAGFDKYVMKPFTLATNLDDRDFLAQVEAVDRFMASMLAYPGRTFGQIYHRMLRRNDLAQGRMVLGQRTIELAGVTAPVLSIAGEGDGIAPVKAVHRVAELLPGAASVRVASAPGGHLGVLTGRAARRTTWPLIDAFLEETAVPPGRARPPRRHLRAVA
ncbi:alpha/beta fold hydrolase [Conexibacter arvalis]|uniref:Polyhydroxyalkanoate synthase n=1 Tax=Conexibacter arvalis TaxID=912552 RepID=A0A840IA20_9ACTN|nr:alpha/beta fold hydrolase [Conexibacter arvalis]MBB4661205.1 polyhydroxyalkanoate synthase [Conexibacter arvalis]